MTVKEYADYIINGNNLTKEEALLLAEADIDELAHEADRLRKHFCGNSFDMCTIINAKSGKCSENCKYCAQSSHYSTEVEEYPLLPVSDIVTEAKRNEKQGVLRFSIVTSGRRLTDSEVDNVCESYRQIKKETGIEVCASHGLLDERQFRKLKEAGVTRIHNNLETSRRNFPNICTTHTYDDKIEAIQAAMRAGIHVCSGGIIGMGETMEDRIDMILDIRSLGIRSVPVNILNP
ncbi:MAG: biotin synthase BioB, partial [Lachnospiraceae bacterium]|nr:biotin synthase BioB [Lachnospiraceae bacterium]